MQTRSFRDGTSQRSRSLRALSPDYVAVDERTLADWLRFAQEFAAQLNYFDTYPPAADAPQADWSAFFQGDAPAIAAALDAIATDSPAVASLPASLVQTLAQPHLALFLASLKLLQYPQQQFQTLTQRRLDFYYRQVLQLQHKAATPDKVHVVFDLATGKTQHLLAAGTRLSAGQDAQGQELHYVVEAEQMLTPAQVVSVKSLSVETERIDLAKLHRGDDRRTFRTNASFETMLRWALGMPNQGDRLPPLIADNGAETPMTVELLNAMFGELHAAQQQHPDEALLKVAQELDNGVFNQQYILERLCFASLEDFYACFDVHTRELTRNQPNPADSLPTEAEWQQVYRIVDRAFRKRINRDRRLALQQVHQSADFATASEAFMALWQVALGEPEPGEALPPLNGSAVELDTLTHLAASEDPADKAYIQDQLFLSRNDFRSIMAQWQADQDSDTETVANWPEVYRLLERAQTRKRGFTYPPISRTEQKAVWTRSLAATATPPLTLPRFSPFQAQPAETEAEGEVERGQALGIAIAAPLLKLQSGQRTLTFFLAYQSDSFDRQRVRNLLNRGEMPLAVALSSEDGWLTVPVGQLRQSMQVGDFLLDTEQRAVPYPEDQMRLRSDQVTLPAGHRLDPIEDIHSLLVWPDGRVYQITEVTSDRSATVTLLRTLDPAPESPPVEPDREALPPVVHHYTAAGFYPDTIRFQVQLDTTQPALAAPTSATDTAGFPAPYPVAKVTLRDERQPDGSRTAYYPVFKDFCLQKVHLQVAVGELDGLTLRSDRSVINPKSPFEPFGAQPVSGASLYFFHPELVAQPLDALTLTLTWMGLPEDFATHYGTYHASQVSPDLSNESFQVTLGLRLNRSWQDAAARSLFPITASPLPAIQPLTFTQATLRSLFAGAMAPPFDEPTVNDVLEQSRYFRLELSGPDFQHRRYPLVINQVARARDTDDLYNRPVYPPYTPTVKGITVAYRASATLDPHFTDTTTGELFQIHPFGYTALHSILSSSDQHCPFLPQYDQSGSLYIGVQQLQPEQSLSLLLQMVSGSGNADLPTPGVQWHYLSDRGWLPFEHNQVLSDSTNGLLDSGILRLVMPQAASDRNPLMPLGLHWLRASVTEHGTAMPDVLDIRAQAATATFVDQENDPDHLAQPLAANTIQELVERQAAIATVAQPYSSFGGRRQETSSAFYTRVSERLRHKQRAVTRWDYERLVLEKFPQIYKVKCLTPADAAPSPSAAQVTVVVIPNLTNTAPFLPLEPKVPQYLLREIETYLQAHTSPFVKVVAKNPRYQRIQYRVAVRFRAGVEQGYYLKRLNEELVRFLSPWAYEDQSDIAFGSSIHSSAVIHFIETRPYIDYVANLKLIEQVPQVNAARSTVNVSDQVNSTNLAQVRTADSILVSAHTHFIDLISTSDYAAEEFEGVGYMIIGTDFQIA